MQKNIRAKICIFLVSSQSGKSPNTSRLSCCWRNYFWAKQEQADRNIPPAVERYLFQEGIPWALVGRATKASLWTPVLAGSQQMLGDSYQQRASRSLSAPSVVGRGLKKKGTWTPSTSMWMVFSLTGEERFYGLEIQSFTINASS